jgi:hypothetical protein
MRPVLLTAFLILSCTFIKCYANDTTSLINRVTNFPNNFLSKVNSKVNSLNKGLDKQTEKYLNKLARQEAKLKKKLYKLDSNATKNLFLSNPEQQYATYIQKIKTDSTFDPKKYSGQYLPYADSLQGSLSFMSKNPQIFSSSNINSSEVQNSLGRLRQLQAKMQNTELIQQYIQQRKEQIKQYLLQFAHLPPGISDIYNNYNREQYYYTQQIEEYKNTLDDPDKLFKTVLSLLDKLPVFQTFINNNSMLASLFPTPGNMGSPLALAGLQTRDNITQLLQGQLSGPNAMSTFSQSMGDAQSQMSDLKDRLSNYGTGGGNVDIPNFSPNQQKTKSFFKRIVIGTNIQTQHSTYFYPVTSDIGLSIGYKLKSSTIGFGGSYKIGWGKDINHINVSSQGLSIRSYIDVKAKASFYLSGGLEYNYQQPFNPTDMPALKNWQQSGLMGLSKIVSLNTKVLKQTKVQLLWDFLSYEQIPRTQPFVFRVGYNF